MGGYRAAVDFGTSYTAAACQAGHAAPAVLALLDEGRLSSAVALNEAGQVQAGPYVEEVAALAPERVERTPKRSLDQPDIMLGGQPVQTVDLVAAVLRYVSDELLRQFNGEPPDELWLTHPARWEAGDPRVERLQAAARQAGFPVTTPLAEPCAAALALAAAGQLDAVGEREFVGVYDLGGGTFDVALLTRDPDGGFSLAGEPGGDPELGGEWLDDRLFERLSGQLPADDEASLRDPDSSPDPLRWRRAGFAFRQGIRRAKERLAREASIQIALNPPFSLDHLALSRGELDRTATPLITRSADRFELFLQRNGKTPTDLAAICLVGGSSRLTVVNRILGQRFDRPIATHGDPKSVTALGALSAVPAGAPRTGVTTSVGHPGVPVGGGEGPPGPPAEDYALAGAVPSMAGGPPPAAEPIPEVAGTEPAVVVAEVVRPAATPAGDLPSQESGPPGHEEPAPAHAAPQTGTVQVGTVQAGTVQADGPGQGGPPPGIGTRVPADTAPPPPDGETGSGVVSPRRSRKKIWLLGGGAAAAVIAAILITLQLLSSGNTVTPGHATPQEATAGYWQSILNGNYSKASGMCSYVEPQVQGQCVLTFRHAPKGTGNFTIAGAVTQGTKSLVEVTGSVGLHSQSMSNSDAKAGMPTSAGLFNSVYNNLAYVKVNFLSPTTCIQEGGAWYVYAPALGGPSAPSG